MLDQKEFFDYVGGSGGQHVIRKKKTFLWIYTASFRTSSWMNLFT